MHELCFRLLLSGDTFCGFLPIDSLVCGTFLACIARIFTDGFGNEDEVLSIRWLQYNLQ